MKRIFVVVEGETEERFLRQVVYSHFILHGIHIDAQQWLTNRKLGTKGGGSNFDFVERHINNLISKYKTDPNVYISTMIDLYNFPTQGNTIYDNDIKRLQNGRDKVRLLQEKFSERIPNRNFIPYVQLYEYETLLLSNSDSLSYYYTDKQNEIEYLKNEIKGIEPEDINDTPENAPSKRIIRYLPSYSKQKTTAGVTAAEKIGLHYLRQHCPHFNDWITKIESLSTQP